MKCLYCAEEIKDEAIKCKHCGEWIKEKKSVTKPRGNLANKSNETKDGKKGCLTLTLRKKNKGINIAWFFMIITIGGFLSDLSDVLQSTSGEGSFETGFEKGYSIGGKLGLALLLGMGMLLYSRTKRRKFGHTVRGSKIIDYILVFLLSINFIFPLVSGRAVNGTSEDNLAFVYVTTSLLAYIYAIFARPEKASKP